MNKFLSFSVLTLSLLCTFACAEGMSKQDEGLGAKARSKVIGFDEGVITSLTLKRRKITNKVTEVGNESWVVSVPVKQALDFFKAHIYDFIGDEAVDVKDDVNSSLIMTSVYMQASYARKFTIHLYAKNIGNNKTFLTYSDNLFGLAASAQEATDGVFSAKGMGLLKTITLVPTLPAALAIRAQYRKNIVSATKECLASL